LDSRTRRAGYKEVAVGYGLPGAEDEFAIRLRPRGGPAPSEGFHIAFRALSREAVAGFYRAALEKGGRDNGGVGLHPEHDPDCFAAFVFNSGGHRIEAIVDERA
jgi:hypothetical protein